MFAKLPTSWDLPDEKSFSELTVNIRIILNKNNDPMA